MIKLNIQRFASSNKTANYDLSQYVDTDKPSYLGDYNSDMEKIDTAIHTNATNITATSATAETAKTTADTALSNASDADTKATNAQSTATSALNKAVQNEASINKFNLNNIQKINVNGMSISGGTITGADITIAKDDSDSIMKIYGLIFGKATGPITITIPCNLTVESEYSIYPAGINSQVTDNLGITIINAQELKVQNNQLTLTLDNTNFGNYSIILMPCIYFNKSFNDSSNN